MPASVTYVTGRAGAGKSRVLRRMIRSALDKNKRVFLIVPEQFTFETERELADDFGDGLIGMSVHSFTTLSDFITEETGVKTVFLSPQGRRMFVRRAILKCGNKLTAFSAVAQRSGFAEKCDELFELCARFDISPEKLSQASRSIPQHELLAQKLHDLSLIYTAADNDMRSRGVSSSDVFNAVIQNIPNSSLCGASVFIDGFDLMTEQLYSIVGALLDVCAELAISIRTDRSAACRDRQIFAVYDRTFSRIDSEAQMRGCKTDTITLASDSEHFASKALTHMEHEAFAYPPRKFDGECTGIRIFAASDRYSEADAACDAILSAAKENGMRFRDMAIIASDMTAYAVPVARALKSRNIPCFTDAKHPLSSYPPSRFILFSLRAVMRGFNRLDVLEVLKTGILPISSDEAELFENYVLRFGINGRSFLSPFTRGDTTPEAAEAAREALITPLLSLRGSLAGANTFAGKTEALYAFIKDSGMYEYQQSLCDDLHKQGRFELMEENAQVCSMLTELLSQMHEIMGDADVSTQIFAAMFTEGLSCYDVGSIPATADQLLFGSVGRTRARSLKAIFILGATEGDFPKYTPDDSVINDAELKKLAELGLTPWYGSSDMSLVSLTDVYSAVTKPRELLYISYPMSVGSDSSAPPCALIDRIRDIFPQLSVENDPTATGSESNSISPSPAGAFSSLVRRLRKFADTAETDPLTSELYSDFINSPEYRDRLLLIESALYSNNSPEPFGRELALELYGRSPHGSASRLETFNACPFKHFARYGLKLTPRKEYREQRVDEGTFCHDALDKFTVSILNYGKSIDSITKDDIDDILAKILPSLLAEHNNGILLSSPRFKAMARRLCGTVRETAVAILKQLSNGSFKPYRSELVFGDGDDAVFPPIKLDIGGGLTYRLSGKIDRVDVADVHDTSDVVSASGDDGAGPKEREESRLFRVIDYKGSDRTFSFADLYHGLSLQLPLYISAVLATNSAAKAAGIYYQTYKTPSAAENGDTSAFEDELMKQFRLRGLTLCNEQVIKATGGTMGGVSAASALAQTEFSSVTDYALTKAADTAARIFDGEARPSPYRKGTIKTACDYCDYLSICRFDIRLLGCTYRNIASLKRSDFMERVNKDGLDS